MSGEVVLYRTEDGRTRLSVRFEDGSVWLTQASIAELFKTTPQNITMHLAAIYEEGELREEATCKDYLQVRREGLREVRRNLKHYNLEAVLAVGYRVRSPRGTQFRQWATSRLGLNTWKGEVVRKGDVTVSKNYLREGEIAELNRIVVMFLDFAEDQARRRTYSLTKSDPNRPSRTRPPR